MNPPVPRLELEYLLQSGGFMSPAFVELDSAGVIEHIYDRRPEAWNPGSWLRVRGFAIPGMPNVHSHSFQRAMVGRTEWRAPDREDSFWTWRMRMYEVAETIEPDELEVISTQLYIEMLEAGITSVGEFHYLHHAVGGGMYADHAELSLRILSAAHRTGIALTHLPVLYQQGGFNRPPLVEQRRFLHADVDVFIDLLARLSAVIRPHPRMRLGVAPHSLRAVGPESLAKVIGDARALDPDMPVHIHASEQIAEVEECLQHLGARPVEWLIDEHEVDARWCLIHATHLSELEIAKLAESGAVAGVCPTTEGNLGDGFFSASKYLSAGGRMGIGSDSQVNVDPAEDLRLLEYGQRLRAERRNRLAPVAGGSVARHLFEHAVEGGARALAQPVGMLRPGRRFDVAVLDPQHPRLLGHGPETVLDAWIFGSASGAVKDVFVAGDHLVREGKHVEAAGVKPVFESVMREIIARGV